MLLATGIVLAMDIPAGTTSGEVKGDLSGACYPEGRVHITQGTTKTPTCLLSGRLSLGKEQGDVCGAGQQAQLFGDTFP